MFEEYLKRMVAETEGSVAGLLMGFDGIAVAQTLAPDAAVDILTVGMEFSFILGQVRKAAEILELGAVEEITIRAEKMTICMRILNPQYFVALALRPAGNLGKGRYLLRVVAPKLQAEF